MKILVNRSNNKKQNWEFFLRKIPSPLTTVSRFSVKLLLL